MKRKSGIEKVPRVLKEPFWTDRFFWIALGTAVFWIGVTVWIFME
ncbi:MAG: hypothetical protein AAGA53_05060 [Pseudomonadota bacterium]